MRERGKGRERRRERDRIWIGARKQRIIPNESYASEVSVKVTIAM